VPIDSLRSDIRRIAELASSGIDRAVPDCGEWTIGQVLEHLSGVYSMVAEILLTRATGPVRPVPSEGDPLEVFRARSEELLTAVSSVDPAEPVWTWTSDKSAGFYVRRMTNETLVHRCDIERASDLTPTIDRDRAVDVVDEYLDLMLPGFLARKPELRPIGSLHLHCTDGAGEWLAVPIAEGLAVTREHAKGDCAWRGPASGLALAVWGRRVSSVDVVGSAEVSDSWRRAAP